VSVHCLLRVQQGQVFFSYDLLREFFAARFLADRLQAISSTEDPFKYFLDYHHQWPTVRLVNTIAELIEYRIHQRLDKKSDEALVVHSNELKILLAERSSVSAGNERQLVSLWRGWVLPLSSLLERNRHVDTLESAIVSDLNFSGKPWVGLYLQNLVFQGCNFEVVAFRSNVFRNVQFLNCSFTQCEFSENDYGSSELIKENDGNVLDDVSTLSYYADHARTTAEISEGRE
jgi:hypothetical protein